jgi:CYTH domain-containing protein
MSNSNNLEIERKFLLKRVPRLLAKDVTPYELMQIYVEIDGKINRFRRTENLRNKEVSYIHCVKTKISDGVYEEIEKEINEWIFDRMVKRPHRFIVKRRTVYVDESLLKWEIDEYDGMSLITLEVELDDINQPINIPEKIEKEIIAEVTGKKEFSNYSLSEEG